ncbi:MAG: dihydrodipicolinate synthase family protein [Planctomycetes bacterium]|nr:dihydrodipicolinate synthase family protein [Planctomycetota bacterium]
MQKRLFAGRLPHIWCPPLTHYNAKGLLDQHRITVHLKSLRPHVNAFFALGSTSDGWELSESEAFALLGFLLEQASRLEVNLIIGALRTETQAAIQFIQDTLKRLRKRFGARNDLEALQAARVCGFMVCPPQGKDLPQDKIHDALASILELGLPTALYQLPQVTGNEFSPDTLRELASHYANFYLLKDSSGQDRVALSGVDLAGVLLTRGAEGEYGRWLKEAGGPYDGLFLSTANCFAPQLYRLMELLKQYRYGEAERLSEQLSAVVKRVFERVQRLPHGNAFANANKAIDHFMAHGRKALQVPPPALHNGSTLPPALLQEVGEILGQEKLLPAIGYLHSSQ